MRWIWLLLLSVGLSACSSFGETQKQNKHLAEIDANLALVNLTQHKQLPAKAELLAALKLAPDDAKILVVWGYYLAKTGDSNAAAQAYQQAMRLAPDDPEIQEDYAAFLYEQKDYVLALNYFLTAAENEHYLYAGLAYKNASLAAKNLGQIAEAERYQQKAEKMLGSFVVY